MTHRGPIVRQYEVRAYFEHFKDDEQSHAMNVAEFIERLLEKYEYAKENKTKVWVFGSLRNATQLNEMINIADKIL